MKRSLMLVFTMLSALVLSAQTAHFSYFKYEGKDARFEKNIEAKKQYVNPVVSGFYPDPSVCRVGDTYWLVNSTFAYFPGVPIFKSHDLVNWHQVGHVLDRESQLPLKGADIGKGGIYAPQISYNPKNKTYYMTTMNMTTFQVFYVKSKNPEKGWSEPVQMKRGGMDTSFFFDTDGKAYVVYNTRPNGGAKYEAQTAIHMNEFDWKADSIKSKTYELTTGSSCIEHPTCIEGPHLYKVGKYYYLMCAEHGTGFTHSEVIFRSKSVFGPWENCPNNPILTQRDLPDHQRQDAVTCTGHADLVQTKEGDWWAVFLGCRPYKIDTSTWEPDYYNTGRETFLLPVTWKDGWPVILEKGKAVPTVVNKKLEEQQVGNIAFTDKFSSNQLNLRWIFLRNPNMSNYDWKSGTGITLKADTANIYGKESPTAILCRQKNLAFSAETEVNFTPCNNQELAGLVVFQNNENNFVVGVTLLDGKPSLTLTRTEGGKQVLMASAVLLDVKQPVRLKVDANGRSYTFSYALADGVWQTLAKGCDGQNLSTKVAGGFVGTTIGLYATAKK